MCAAIAALAAVAVLCCFQERGSCHDGDGLGSRHTWSQRHRWLLCACCCALQEGARSVCRGRVDVSFTASRRRFARTRGLRSHTYIYIYQVRGNNERRVCVVDNAAKPVYRRITLDATTAQLRSICRGHSLHDGNECRNGKVRVCIRAGRKVHPADALTWSATRRVQGSDSDSKRPRLRR